LSLFNSNTSSLIQFFILNGNLLIFVVPLNLNSLKFVKCSNSVGILLKESHQIKLRVCNWVNNPICVGSDVIPLNESERCWSDVSWEICDESVSSCFVQSNSNTWSEGSWHTTEISVSLRIFVLLSERWRNVNFVIEDGSWFSSWLFDNKMFEMMSSWRLSHSIHWFHTKSI
jgi:hypothetical protein